jgi:hypothetical protein
MTRTSEKESSMKLFMRILIGLGTMIGGFLGLVALSKNETVSERLKDHYDESMKAAQEASAAKRQELESEIERMKAK